MFYEPRNGHGLPHDPLKSLVAPRPIGWISTRSLAGEVNLAPYSFFNLLQAAPPIVYFASESAKDSYEIARETGEFVVNIVGRELAAKMNASSVDAPRGVNEFGYAGLTEAASNLVSAPRVAEAPAALECKVTEIMTPRLMDGSSGNALVVIGQVVGIHIADEMLVDGLFNSSLAGNVARLGYFDFSSADSLFAMRRPRWDGNGNQEN
ncbi:MAG: flavin reductase family protein [Rhizobiaceae bacterium]